MGGDGRRWREWFWEMGDLRSEVESVAYADS